MGQYLLSFDAVLVKRSKWVNLMLDISKEHIHLAYLVKGYLKCIMAEYWKARLLHASVVQQSPEPSAHAVYVRRPTISGTKWPPYYA